MLRFSTFAVATSPLAHGSHVGSRRYIAVTNSAPTARASASRLDLHSLLRNVQRRHRLLMPGHGVIVLGANALVSGWGTIASDAVCGKEENAATGFVVGISPGRPLPLAASRYGCAALLTDGPFADLSVLARDNAALVQELTGRGSAEGTLDDEAVIDVILADLLPPPSAAAEAEAAGGSARHAAEQWALGVTRDAVVQGVMDGLQAAAPLLSRDAAILCRVPVPKGNEATQALKRGLHAVFAECHSVATVPGPSDQDGGATQLLLARGARSVKATSGFVKRNWEKYHNKTAPLQLLRERAFFRQRNSRAGGTMNTRRLHFTKPLPSHNLERVPPSRTARKAIDAVRRSAADAKRAESLENLRGDLAEETIIETDSR